jgi:hypothetical protein
MITKQTSFNQEKKKQHIPQISTHTCTQSDIECTKSREQKTK